MDHLVAQQGAPQALRSDNRPELIAQSLTGWCEAHCITIRYMHPGKRDEIPFLKHFNCIYRVKVLDVWHSTPLTQVPDMPATWL
ncbi:MAG: hypothetical protein KBF47_02045 [Gemmatimonadales bacterium]|nr:hypothetical protein [Gemmatimonadales bacterium]